MSVRDARWWLRPVVLLFGLIATTEGWTESEQSEQFSIGHPLRASDASCSLSVLLELGWKLHASPANSLQVHAGTPCDRASLADAQAHGDLILRLSGGPEQVLAHAADLKALLEHPATLCGWSFRLGEATRRAVDRLAGNEDFRFSGLQLGWIGFGWGGAAQDGWQRIDPFGRAFRPLAGNTRAIEGFYNGSVRSECGVGRQIAQYATQAELYGAAFDQAFDADELVIGTFVQLHGTRSILLGSEAGEFVRDGRARLASAQGRQAFVGLPGFLVHVLHRSTLDDYNNQAQNFVVVDVSAEAAAALRAHGGFDHYNSQNRRLWRLASQLSLRPPQNFLRLLIDRDQALRSKLRGEQVDVLAQLDAIIADPFYRGFSIYVHPQGIQPVGFHIARMLDLNPRTPYRIELALHNVHTTLYRRHVAHLLAQCAQEPVPVASDRSNSSSQFQ
jgi:hypothetical protein